MTVICYQSVYFLSSVYSVLCLALVIRIKTLLGLQRHEVVKSLHYFLSTRVYYVQ